MTRSDPTPKPIRLMTPDELAAAGIPAEVALRARIDHYAEMAYTEDRVEAYRDALAIIEAKR